MFQDQKEQDDNTYVLKFKDIDFRDRLAFYVLYTKTADGGPAPFNLLKATDGDGGPGKSASDRAFITAYNKAISEKPYLTFIKQVVDFKFDRWWIIPYSISLIYDYFVDYKTDTGKGNKFIKVGNDFYNNEYDNKKLYLAANSGTNPFAISDKPPTGTNKFDVYPKAVFESQILKKFKYVSIPSGTYFLSNYSNNSDPTLSGQDYSIQFVYSTTEATDPTKPNQDQYYVGVIKVKNDKGEDKFLAVIKNADGTYSYTLENDVNTKGENLLFVISNDGLIYNYKEEVFLVPPPTGKKDVKLSDINVSKQTPNNKWWITQIKQEPLQSNITNSLWNVETWKVKDLLTTRREEVITFCAQYDTVNKTAFYDSNNFILTCLDAVNKDINLGEKIREKYCSIYKNSTLCSKNCDKACRDAIVTECISSEDAKAGYTKLRSDQCLYYCQLDENKRCNPSIQRYCESKGFDTSAYSLSPENAKNERILCGPFLKDTFYKNFYTSLKELTNIDQNITNPNPICLFPYSNKNASIKNEKNVNCTDIEACFSATKVSADGKINSPVIISTDDVCANIKPKEFNESTQKPPPDSEKLPTWQTVIIWVLFGLAILGCIIGIYKGFTKKKPAQTSV
jgi:hypothetical protein